VLLEEGLQCTHVHFVVLVGVVVERWIQQVFESVASTVVGVLGVAVVVVRQSRQLSSLPGEEREVQRVIERHEAEQGEDDQRELVDVLYLSGERSLYHLYY